MANTSGYCHLGTFWRWKRRFKWQLHLFTLFYFFFNSNQFNADIYLNKRYCYHEINSQLHFVKYEWMFSSIFTFALFILRRLPRSSQCSALQCNAPYKLSNVLNDWLKKNTQMNGRLRICSNCVNKKVF